MRYNMKDFINEEYKIPNTKIDLDSIGDFYVRIGTLVYKIDVEKLVKDYGSIVSIINDNKTEE